MKKILDYEEMLKFLRELNHEIIEEQEPIGNSEFGEPNPSLYFWIWKRARHFDRWYSFFRTH